MLKPIYSRVLLGPVMLLGLSSLNACACFSDSNKKTASESRYADELNSSKNVNPSKLIAQIQKVPEAKYTMTSSEHPLSWVNDADPLADAQQAIASSDFRLLAFSGRVVSIPGIDLSKLTLDVLQRQCGYRTIKGTGDTLRIGEQTSLRSKAHDYAVIYNQHILTECELP
ncbi:hypothetical protein [Paraglaciecola sp. 20A4]|uniref:hypothetical protein n=1 Tax=Paraglaciecola sp. 20A4 TaxID=2687288 RepID=UPI00140A6CF9|nr:hypothetical protein [Paraglaciecola sp. 20A4]